jgi:diguanylate cyclase (GGDEF)-like protein
VSVKGKLGLSSPLSDDDRLVVAQRRFGDALLAADGRQADAEAHEALRACSSVAEVHVRVITPAMYWIGELWNRGAITIADEHAATAIAHRVLASLYSSQTNRPLNVRDTVLLAAPGDEHHGLGLRIVSDLLELSGFRVVYLGADTPADALAAAVARHAPSLVGLSLTMSREASGLEQAIAAVAAVQPATPILLGGLGVPQELIDSGFPYLANVERLVAEVERLTSPGPPLLRDRTAPVRDAQARGRRPPPTPGTREDQMLDVAIDMGQMVSEQTRQSTRLRALAFKDYLTGLPNQRGFDDRFAELTADGSAHHLAVLLLDVDKFEQINDEHGHEEGNQALGVVADALRHHIRAGDVAARLGGDEFAALLARIETDEVLLLAERLQRRITELSGPAQLTVSIGVAWFDGDRRRTMLNADAALYRAKASGRNLTCMTEGHPEHPSLIVADIMMPTMHGYELVQDLRGGSGTADLPEAFSTATRAVEEVRRLANAFLQQQPDPGIATVDDNGANLVVAPGSWLVDVLSPRELQVLSLVAEGASNAEIASRLVIGDATVQSHVKHILRKLGVRNRTEAAGQYLTPVRGL